MAKIRWREKDLKNLTNAVRRFNYQIDKILKKDSNAISYLPQRQTVKNLRNIIDTRNDFNREIRSLNRIRDKNALQKIRVGDQDITRWEKKDNELRLNLINKKRTQIKNNLVDPEKSFSNSAISETNLTPKTINYNTRNYNYYSLRESLINQSRDLYFSESYDTYKENYLKAINNTFGSEGKKLYNIVKNTPSDILAKLYYDDPVFQLKFIYIESDKEISDIVDILSEIWSDKLEEF